MNLALLSAFWVGAGVFAGDLAERFRDPPRDRRVLQIIHNFPGEAEDQRALIRRLLERGFGGLVANVHFDDYLVSEARWKSFEAGAEAARAADLVVWLYDEQGYPSGAAGGLTLEGHPEWQARGLLCVIEDSAPDRRVEVEVPEGSLVHAAAYPLRREQGVLSEAVDLRSSIQEGRRLKWDRPGRWRICAFVEAPLYEGTHATENLFRKRPLPNLLERGPAERFIELTHEAYARRLGPLRDRFEAIFTDEPSLMSVFIKPAPRPALPWAPGLAAAFRAAKGYDLIPALPALAADFGPEGRRIRCDFWEVVGSEVASNYFGAIQDWCHAHGIASTGHLLAEEDLGSHIGFYGNFYACAARLDYPGIDCLTSDPAAAPWHIAKLIGSIACRFGRPRAMSETSDHAQRYRPPGDTRPPRAVSAGEILGTAHLLYSAGINVTTSYYSWANLDDGAVRRVNEHIGRLGAVLAGARHVCEVAVVYPTESAWSRFVPQRQWAASPEVARIDSIYRDVCYTLYRARRDFDIIDSAALAGAEPGDGTLAVGAERYRALVLPAIDVLPFRAMEKAASLVRRGGAVIAVGEVPVNTPASFPSAAVGEAAGNVFSAAALSGERDAERLRVHSVAPGGPGVYLPEGSAWLLPVVIDSILEPDLQAPAGSPLRYSRWAVEGKHAYFVINDSAAPCSGAVRCRGEGSPELWDPATGAIGPLEAAGGGGWRVDLPSHGAAFLVFAGARGPQPAAAGLEIGGRIEEAPLDGVARSAPRIELNAAPGVEAAIASLDAGAAGAPAREVRIPARISARIIEGGKDSWCFAELRFPELLDLSRFRAIEVNIRVAGGQEGCAAKLYVIIREEGEGGEVADYIADLRRPLGEAGSRRASLPLDAFRLAGWSRDPDGQLDLARIRALRIGWGGYTGRAGENVAFVLEEIHLLRLR